MELRVARAFTGHGWQVQHARGYEDGESQKTREVDIIATRSQVVRVEKQRHILRLSLVIECKTSTDKPWVAFRNRENVENSWFALEESLGHESTLLLIAAHDEGAHLSAPYDVTEGLCHGVIKGFANPKEGDPTAPYAALQSVLSAARALAAERERMRRTASFARRHLEILLPLVVLGAPLFAYDLGDAGQDQLTATGFVAVTLPTATHPPPTWAPVVTEQALTTLLTPFTESADRILTTLTSSPERLAAIAALIAPPGSSESPT